MSGRVGEDGDGQDRRRGRCADHRCARQRAQPQSGVREVKHDHDRAAALHWRTSGLSVVFMLVVPMFWVVLPIVELVERNGVTMNVVAVMVVDEEGLLGHDERRQHGKGHQHP